MAGTATARAGSDGQFCAVVSPQAGEHSGIGRFSRGTRFAPSASMLTARIRPATPEAPRILSLRSVTVVFDEDLARLYGVTTSQLNQALKRNRRRFPKDFAFQLTAAECRILRSQSVISSGRHGGRRTQPWASTEHGAIMAASLLNTARAIDMSVFVVRAFVRLREWAAPHRALVAKLDAIEQRVSGHDDDLEDIIATLRRLIAPPARTRRAIGFSSPAAAPPAARAGAARRQGR